jgi:hypothetical protein
MVIKEKPGRWIVFKNVIIVLIHHHHKLLEQNMNNFIFSILLKQQQNGLKTNQTKGVWPHYCEDWTKCYDKLTQFAESYKLILPNPPEGAIGAGWGWPRQRLWTEEPRDNHLFCYFLHLFFFYFKVRPRCSLRLPFICEAYVQ